MLSRTSLARRLQLCLFVLFLLSVAARAQDNPQGAQERADEVLRINTDLVQTDVSVFDEKGKFVEGLTREQFELKVDGRAQPISFFDRLRAGSPTEAAQLSAARRSNSQPNPTSIPTAIETTGGRTIIFFIDDLHLTPEGIHRTRELVTKFIDKDMGAGDQALIVAASGQVGFLQQLTDNKEALRAALARIKYQSRSLIDSAHRPMTVYEARAIERNDASMLDYKVNEVMVDMRVPPNKIGLYRRMAESEVRISAQRTLQMAASFDRDMLIALESLMRGVSALPGRKLAFFISGGFVLGDAKRSDAKERLREITASAARSGVVFYTVDARGLFTTNADASTDVAFDTYDSPHGIQLTYEGVAANEAVASQEPLRILAKDTGGRAIMNHNDLESGLTKAVQETSEYYLLAWQPERGSQAQPAYRNVEVSVKGRPELTVYVHRSVFENQPVAKDAATESKIAAATTPNAALNAALNSFFARNDLGVSLYPAFTNNAQSGSTLTTSVQLSSEGLGFEKVGNKQSADVDVAYVVLNSQGKPVTSSGRRLTFTEAAGQEAHAGEATQASKIMTNFTLTLPAPGLYQVRVAARDSRTGRIGSAFQWIEAPEFKAGNLALSSLLMSEVKAGEKSEEKKADGSVMSLVDVDRRFARASSLLFQIYIYNAALPANGAPPSVTMEIEVLRGSGNGQSVMKAPAHPVMIQGTDFSRIRYTAAIPLKSLPAGVYTLQVKATDQTTKKSITQKSSFIIE